MTRILTYNVHRCVGTDRRLDVGRVSEVIAACEPDIVALQELDVGRARTGGVDQAHEIAHRLGMSFHFNAALRVEEEQYGDALLTDLPERLIKAGPLPGLDPRIPLEPRGAVWIEVMIAGRPVQVINTHLGLAPSEQQQQARALAGDPWICEADRQGPTILLGDFNAGPASLVYRILTRRLQDARIRAPGGGRCPTFPSRMPLLRIDHLFVNDGIEVTGLSVAQTRLARRASDHLPLVMDFELAEG
jgi:endonuclease/exonuclease/phosphatase family metal-dependent hydrolase